MSRFAPAVLAVLAAACGATVDVPGGGEPAVPVADDGFDDGFIDDVADDEADGQDVAGGGGEGEGEGVVIDDDDDEEEVAGEGEGEGATTETPPTEETPPAEETPPTPPSTPSQPAATPAPTAVEVVKKVLHWNIAGGKENDCRTEGITRAVRRYVEEHDVDFVGLNEVCPSQYASIKEALRRAWNKGDDARFSAYVGDGDIGREVGNAIFSKQNLTGITREKVGEDQYGDRNLLCGKVASQPHLRFCSTHLTPGDAKARVQMGRVLERIEGFWNDRRDTVILSGDLNLVANDAGLDSVYSSQVDTPNNRNNRGRYREADDDDAAHCRGYGERSHAGNGGPCGEGGKIDFIFFRANRLVDGEHGGDTLNIPGDCTGACSDHRAVVGRARLKVRVD